MTKYLTVEHTSTVLPALLIIDFAGGNKNHLSDLIVKSLESKTKIYILSKKKNPSPGETISSLSVHFLDRLNGSLPYSIVFLDNTDQKKQIIFALRKLASQNTKIVLLIPRRIVGQFLDVVLELKTYSHVFVILTGDMFGMQSAHTTLSKTIEEALVDQVVFVSENDTIPIFPIADTDLLNLISHVLFGNPTSHVILKGYYNNPQTLLSLSHLLKRYEPELSLEFFKNGRRSNTKDEFIQDRTIKERLGNAPENVQGVFMGFTKTVLLMQEALSHRSPRSSTKQKKEKVIFSKRIKQITKQVVVFFIAGFLVYMLVSIVIFVLSAVLFKEGASQLMDGKTQSAVKTFAVSRQLYNATHKNIDVLLSIPSIPALQQARNYTNTFDDLQMNTLPAVHVIEMILSGKKLTSENLILLESFARDFYFFTLKQDSHNINLIGSKNFVSFSQFLPLIQTLREIGGYDSEKSYLILFQNSNELRPTGGFIGSVGYSTVKDGSLLSTQVQDVYDLDGQLKGHVEPHFVIRRNLQPNLYLRDSNFNPDFNVSASASAFLYNIESGKQVDGVIGIDTFVLKKLMEIAGPIQIPGQATKLTPENVTSLIQDSIQSEFFPGSIEKKQILNSLVSKILVSIESDQKKQLQLIEALPQLLSEKHILFSFPNQSIQNTFEAAGFAGSTVDTRIQNKDVLDFLSVNEANIGVNKVNEFIKREVSYSAVIHPDEISSDVLLSLTNPALDDYRAYIRFIIPENAVITGITINGETQNIIPAVTDASVYERKVFKLPTGLEVDQETQNGKKMVGFIVNTPQKTQSRIHVLYTTQYLNVMNGKFDYSLLFIKQPGTDSYPFTAQLEVDESFKVSKNTQPILFSGTISTDKEFKKEVLRIKK